MIWLRGLAQSPGVGRGYATPAMPLSAPASQVTFALFATLCACNGQAAADYEANLRMQPANVTSQPPAPAPDAPIIQAPATTAPELAATGARVEYGAEGSRWWIVTAGWGHGVSSSEEKEAEDFNVAAAFSYFIVKDIEVNAELGAWYHNQSVDDAFSGNLSMAFRWHFYNNQKWTLFADAGLGAILASDEVPQEGTNFAFTPRIGGGFTRRLGDSDSRLILGVRWQHFSNARVLGDDDNPGRDDLMIYAGVVFPF